MKRLKLYLYLLWMVVLPMCAKTTPMDVSDISSPKVLVISSYQVETDWSKVIIDEVVTKLNLQYPDIYIHVGYMNLNTYTLSVNPLYTLRSVLWSYADSDPTMVSAEDSHINTLFLSEKHPDVLVFIGSEALLFYQMYGPWLGKWRDVPVVVCGVFDDVVTQEWLPTNDYDFNTIAPIEERRKVETFIFLQNSAQVDEGLILKEHTKDGYPGYLTDVDYKLTGVKATLPIRENLELIHHLVPDLEEIIWIDNDFYSSDYAQWLVKKELAAILPNVGFSKIRQNRFNTDSIYNEILKPVYSKVYLTYSWDINGIYSRQTNEQIQTLFANYSVAPLFSLTQRSLSNPYWVGGYYRSYTEFADKTVKQISRILNGESADDIPFETVSSGQITFDQLLLKKYGLWKDVQSLTHVKYVNIPPTYYEKNEGMILSIVIIGAILLGGLAYWLIGIRYTRKIHREYVRYRKLYNKLHLIYGHTSIDLALYDKDGKLIFYITKGQEQRLGNYKGELFSENLFDNSNLNHSLKQQIRNNQPINTEVTVDFGGSLSSVDSERKVYQLMVNPLNDENAQSAKYVAIAIDLNQVIREREERERFEGLVRFASDSSQMGIAFYDIDKVTVTATNSWYQNLNESFASDVLPTYENVIPEDRVLLIDYRDRVRKGETLLPFNKDILVFDADGKEHWITQHVFVSESNKRMLIELNLNIDEQKMNEINLLKAKKKVEQSIVATQEFLANINHEIRTPLNSIVGFSAILAASEDDEERKEHISIILKNNKLLTMLIDDVIELSKIDSGQTTFEWEPVEVDALFAKVMTTGYSELYNKHLNIVLDSDKDHPVIYTDSDGLFRLLSNLFSNAIKFTQEGTVTLGYRKQEDHYYFFVKDTGTGINSKDQRRIFKRFDKLNSYVQGTGLGLALCKSIVEHLGGEIGIESKVGTGSTFWFVLPVR